MVFGVGGSNGAISGLIKSKMAADGHLGMMALSVMHNSCQLGFLVYVQTKIHLIVCSPVVVVIQAK